jgi:3D (Asp-Asp-Asp) domain-containing protein
MHIASQAADVAALLADAGVKAGREDLVFPALDTRIVPGLSVVVRHATPVTVLLGGSEHRVNVVGQTVADALVAAGVDPERASGVAPGLDTPLKSGMRIVAPDCFTRVSAEDSLIPFAVSERRVGTLPPGVRRVVREGVAGTRVNIFRAVVTAGIEGSATLAAQRVIKEPVAEIVEVGTGDGSTLRQLEVAGVSQRAMARMVSAPKGRTMRVVATGYSGIEPGAGGIGTASGRRAERGVIAVDPNVIPLGTRLYVPGYGYGVAGDTGSMINGRHVDLCFDSMAGIKSWGKRTVTITLLD